MRRMSPCNERRWAVAAEWFYSNGSDRLGPVTASELRELALQGQLQPTSLIWKEGMGNWAPASKVKDITFSTAMLPCGPI